MVPKVLVQAVFILNTGLLSGSLESWYILGTPVWQAPNKNLVLQSLMNIWPTIFYICCHSSLLEELSITCVISLRENSCKLVPVSICTLPHAPFPFNDCALYPYIVIITSLLFIITLEYNYMLYPWIVLESDWIQRWSWGPQQNN